MSSSSQGKEQGGAWGFSEIHNGVLGPNRSPPPLPRSLSLPLPPPMSQKPLVRARPDDAHGDDDTKEPVAKKTKLDTTGMWYFLTMPEMAGQVELRYSFDAASSSKAQEILTWLMGLHATDEDLLMSNALDAISVFVKPKKEGSLQQQMADLGFEVEVPSHFYDWAPADWGTWTEFSDGDAITQSPLVGTTVIFRSWC